MVHNNKHYECHTEVRDRNVGANTATGFTTASEPDGTVKPVRLTIAMTYALMVWFNSERDSGTTSEPSHTRRWASVIEVRMVVAKIVKREEVCRFIPVAG